MRITAKYVDAPWDASSLPQTDHNSQQQPGGYKELGCEL